MGIALIKLIRGTQQNRFFECVVVGQHDEDVGLKPYKKLA